MGIARLLAFAFVLCTLSVFAQENQIRQTPPLIAATPTAGLTNPLSTRTLNPVLTDIKPPLDSLSQKDAHQIHEQLNKDNYHILPPAPDRTHVFVGDTVWPDSTCYTIRSYVVARDEAGSDSTHPVSYSTCQPGSRYGLKTTELKQNSPSR
jgi:hypothetical protein